MMVATLDQDETRRSELGTTRTPPCGTITYVQIRCGLLNSSYVHDCPLFTRLSWYNPSIVQRLFR